MSSSTCAGVDVGGGGIRVRIDGGEGIIAGEDTSPVPRDRGRVDLPRLAARVAAVIETSAPGVDRLEGMAIGVTGLPGLVKDPETLWHALGDRFGLGALVVAGDMVTTHAGALGFRAGVVVAAGTGVITLGTDLDGVWNQADGWGHLLGDHGSGAWIGSQGLQAALRAHDRRSGGSTALLEHMTARFGHPLDLVALVYESGSPAHHLASFAPSVAEAAREGDPAARRIWAEAGRQLAQTAVAAAAGLEPVFSWGGRLFDAADLLMEPFQSTVRAVLPDARFIPPLGTSADGALGLAKAAASIEARHPYMYVFSRTDAPAVRPLRRTR
ncbi:BadF-type ATPase [Nonomuraea solani]|uniref:BadF-type ATPase n=1 Tax=Nonomuraea solani TaxID=1144553 RepID=A0A1H6DCJ1_9ACTN|nr:BadF/BadG/BcrA/BcrD ATPase family protein [Nonomuraea solani]SEG82990.1 BadF-type ATPase [Nonomuraea solani]